MHLIDDPWRYILASVSVRDVGDVRYISSAIMM